MSKEAKKILNENEHGVIYRYNEIPSTMFNFYVLKKRKYADGTHQYNICVELASDTSRYWILDTLRGSKEDAIKRLDEIIANG